MAQIYANGSSVTSNKSIFEAVVLAASNGSVVSTANPLTITSTNLISIDGKLPTLSEGRVQVEVLGVPLVARQLNATAASNNTVLSITCRRLSMHARTADIRYSVGNTAQTANSTSHFIASGERLDIDVPSTPNIAIIRAGTIDGILEVSEIS